MKPLPLLALFLAAGCGQAPVQNNAAAPRPYRPPTTLPTANLDGEQTAIVDRIEREVRLPGGADPIASYARYYAWQRSEDGSRKVVGVYGHGGPPGRFWTEENALPLIIDGGCDLVTLRYDVVTQRIEHIACNGSID